MNGSNELKGSMEIYNSRKFSFFTFGLLHDAKAAEWERNHHNSWTFLSLKKLFYSSPTLCSLTNIFPSFKTSENKRIKFLQRKFCGGIPLSSAHPIFEMWTELLFSCSFPWVVSWAVHAAVIQQNLIRRKNTKLYQKETTFVVPSGGDSEQLYVSLLQPSLRII